MGFKIKKELKYFQKKSIFMVGKKKDLESLVQGIQKSVNLKDNQTFLIRGNFGSGKSLFIRRALCEFVDKNKNYRPNRYILIYKVKHFLEYSFLTKPQ